MGTKAHEDICTKLISLVDVAERLVKSAKRRGYLHLSAGEKKILDYWLEERRALEKSILENDHACPLCPGCPLCSKGKYHAGRT